MAKRSKGPRRPKVRGTVTVVRAPVVHRSVVHHVHHMGPPVGGVRPPLVRPMGAPLGVRPPIAPMAGPIAPRPPMLGGPPAAPMGVPNPPLAPRAPLPGPMGPMGPLGPRRF